MKSLSWRSLFLLVFLVAMPVLALPPVARTIDTLLYGAPPADFGKPPAPPLQDASPSAKASSAQAPMEPSVGLLAQATYQEASPAAADVQTATFATSGSPPLLSPAPPFEPLAPTAGDSGLIEEPVNEQAIAQLQAIRNRLESLGADYVLVEVLEGRRYRFHCRMLIDERSRFTKPFEASAFDPVAAGQEVLRAVEAWRAASAAGN